MATQSTVVPSTTMILTLLHPAAALSAVAADTAVPLLSPFVAAAMRGDGELVGREEKRVRKSRPRPLVLVRSLFAPAHSRSCLLLLLRVDHVLVGVALLLRHGSGPGLGHLLRHRSGSSNVSFCGSARRRRPSPSCRSLTRCSSSPGQLFEGVRMELSTRWDGRARAGGRT